MLIMGRLLDKPRFARYRPPLYLSRWSALFDPGLRSEFRPGRVCGADQHRYRRADWHRFHVPIGMLSAHPILRFTADILKNYMPISIFPRADQHRFPLPISTVSRC